MEGSTQSTTPWHWDQRQLARARLPLGCHPLLLPTAVAGPQDGCPLRDAMSEPTVRLTAVEADACHHLAAS